MMGRFGGVVKGLGFGYQKGFSEEETFDLRLHEDKKP